MKITLGDSTEIDTADAPCSIAAVREKESLVFKTNNGTLLNVTMWNDRFHLSCYKGSGNGAFFFSTDAENGVKIEDGNNLLHDSGITEEILDELAVNFYLYADRQYRKNTSGKTSKWLTDRYAAIQAKERAAEKERAANADSDRGMTKRTIMDDLDDIDDFHKCPRTHFTRSSTLGEFSTYTCDRCSRLVESLASSYGIKAETTKR